MLKKSAECASEREDEGKKRSARLNLRLQPSLKLLLEEAAAASGSTVSDFCLNAVRRAAEQEVRASQTIRLRGHDAKVFFDALMKPAAPNAALKRSARAHAARIVRD